MLHAECSEATSQLAHAHCTSPAHAGSKILQNELVPTIATLAKVPTYSLSMLSDHCTSVFLLSMLTTAGHNRWKSTLANGVVSVCKEINLSLRLEGE